MSTLDNLRQERIDKLEKLRQSNINPYPSNFDKKNNVKQCLDLLGKKVQTAGRIYSIRFHGNIAFADLKDETGKIQIFFKKDLLGVDQYKLLKLIDIGDIIGVEGEV